jgi:hypothetical protein
LQLGSGVQHVLHQRHTGQALQDLGHTAFHAGAFAGGHHNNIYRVNSGHGILSVGPFTDASNYRQSFGVLSDTERQHTRISKGERFERTMGLMRSWRKVLRCGKLLARPMLTSDLKVPTYKLFAGRWLQPRQVPTYSAFVGRWLQPRLVSTYSAFVGRWLQPRLVSSRQCSSSLGHRHGGPGAFQIFRSVHVALDGVVDGALAARL